MLETDVGRGDFVDKARADQKIGGQRRGRAGEKAADATPAPDQFPYQLHRVVVHVHAADGEQTGTLWHQSLDRLGRAEEHDLYRPLDAPAGAPTGTFSSAAPQLPQKAKSAGIPLAPHEPQAPT